MNGRCQGFYCGGHVKALVENKGIEPPPDHHHPKPEALR
jgi:hypothetical protein